MRSAHLLLAAAAVLAPAAPSVAVRRCAPPICCTARDGTTRTDRFSHQLARRINSAAQDSETVQCLLLDCMVPKQRFDLRLPPEVGAAVKEARKNGKTICTLGMEHSFDEQTGRPQFGAVLQRGVEARIESLLPVPMAHGFYSAHTTPRGVGRGGGASKVMMEYDATVIGGRPFELLDPSAVTPKGPLFRAEVRWLDLTGTSRRRRRRRSRARRRSSRSSTRGSASSSPSVSRRRRATSTASSPTSAPRRTRRTRPAARCGSRAGIPPGRAAARGRARGGTAPCPRRHLARAARRGGVRRHRPRDRGPRGTARS